MFRSHPDESWMIELADAILITLIVLLKFQQTFTCSRQCEPATRMTKKKAMYIGARYHWDGVVILFSWATIVVLLQFQVLFSITAGVKTALV